jgi:hypothetical protein
LDEEMRPGAVAMAGVFTGPTSPSILSEPWGPSKFDEQSLIMGKLAEASQEEEQHWWQYREFEQSEEELRRWLQELENVQNQAVTATVVVKNSGGGDCDQTVASSPLGRNGIRFLIGATLVLLLVIGVILGMTIPLTTNKDKDSPSIDLVVMP